MNTEQQQAFDLFKKRKNLFISGPAGTGKTYLIKQIYNYCVENKILAYCTALTGCAALLLNECNAITLHSYAGLGINPTINNINQKYELMKSKYQGVIQRWRSTRVLIVDEISMLDPVYFECIDYIARKITKIDRAMGGIQVIFLGDFYQLPSITNEKGNKRFCFNSPLWDELFDNSTILLKQNMRAKNDIVLTTMLDNIRIGNISESFIKILKERVISEDDIQKMEVKPIRIVPRRATAEYINNKNINKLSGDIYRFQPKVSVSKQANLNKRTINCEIEKIEKNSNYIVDLKLKVGTNVMLIKNMDISLKLVNGSMGVVTDIGKRSVNHKNNYITVKFANGITTDIKREIWKNKTETVSISQYPLIPAYAITIHKIQGQTLDMVCADVGSGIFECGQGYVALSRVKHLNDLYLTNFDEKAIYSNNIVKEYYRDISGN